MNQLRNFRIYPAVSSNVVIISHSQVKTLEKGKDQGFENEFTRSDFHDHLLDGEVRLISAFEHSLDAVKFLVTEEKLYTGNNYFAYFHLFDSLTISSQELVCDLIIYECILEVLLLPLKEIQFIVSNSTFFHKDLSVSPSSQQLQCIS